LKKRFKDIIADFMKNIVAYAAPVALIQLLVQPVIAKKLGEEQNGLFLTIIALMYFSVNITAGILVQTRLLQNEKYEKENAVGDYNIIVIAMITLVVFVMSVGASLYIGNGVKFRDIFLCSILSILFFMQNYISVQYRVELNYTKILFSNIALCTGYIIGILVFWYVFPCWQIVYIIAYGVCEIYDLTHTDYYREPLKKTPLFYGTVKRYFVLAGASLLSYIVSYGDRLLLYPLLDGSSVSILSSAEVMGKMIMLLSTPLTSFFLSYIVKENKINFKITPKIVFFGIAALIVCYSGCCIMSIPMLKFLYPAWADRSMKYVPVVALTSIINLVTHIYNVIIIRFCASKKQITINAVYAVSYLLFSFVLLHYYNLMGFCIGNLAAAVTKLITIIIIQKRNIKQIEN